MLGTSLLWRSTVAFIYLKVKSAKCNCFASGGLGSWSCYVGLGLKNLHHWLQYPLQCTDCLLWRRELLQPGHLVKIALCQKWHNTFWTRLKRWTNVRGLWSLGGPKPDPNFLYILIFQMLGVSHLFYSTADFFCERPTSIKLLITFDQIEWSACCLISIFVYLQ